MLLSKLSEGIFQYTGEDKEIGGITSIPQKIREGDCFVMLLGVFKEKAYQIYEAINRRPAIILTEEKVNTDIPLLIVKNAREILSKLLYRFYFHDEKPPLLIGITGTNGKSSVCHILSHLLRIKYRVGIIGTQIIEANGTSLAPADYTMTTPDPELLYPSLFKMKEMGCEAIVMEISSHALALEKVCALTLDAAIFTGLAEDHLDFHGTREAYKEAKGKIFPLARYAIVNTDCPAGQEYLKRIKIPTDTVGKEHATYAIHSCKAHGFDQIEFVYEVALQKHTISLPLGGSHNAYNALYALAAAIRFGVPEEKAIAALHTIPKIKGRLEVVDESPYIILDYAHTPSSMKTVLEYIRQTRTKSGKIIVVFGAGGDRDRTKRPLMARVAEENADFCVVTTDNTRTEAQAQIFKDLKKGFRKGNHRFILDRTKAIAYAYDLCNENDVLVLLGKGHESYILKGNKKIPYSELYAIHLAKRGQKNED